MMNFLIILKNEICNVIIFIRVIFGIFLDFIFSKLIYYKNSDISF